MRGRNDCGKSQNNAQIMDNAQCLTLKSILMDIIDENVDSLRFYYLGNKYQTKVEHMGIDRGLPVDSTLIL